MTGDDEPSAAPAGPYYSNFGPRDGMIMFGGAPVMGVLASPSGSQGPIGIAWLGGSIQSRRRPVHERDMALLQSRLRRPRFTLAEIVGVVALLAVTFRWWPGLTFATLIAFQIYFCERSGLSVVATLTVSAAVGVVLGIVVALTATS